jgi:putative protease
MIQPELLLPVGDLKMLDAAIHGGAGAVYIGVPGFNARGRSHDFEFEELKQLIQKAHLYGVRVLLAFNILIFEDELEKATETILRLKELQPDALIVQDLGLATLIRKIAPELTIHASTQMTVTNHDAIDLLNDLEIKRFVLGRENSLEEIRLIRQNTNKELEVFVHGALCVAYSGQCLTSENIGGRSANRGQCAQSCRFSYELFADDKPVDLKERQFLLSPQDLCGITEVPELMKLGIESLKIEGRLKSPEYVGSAAHSYQLQIQRTLSNNPLTSSELSQLKTHMGSTYSRGHFSGWLNGVNHQELVDATYSSHRGSKIGTIIKIDSKSIYVQLDQETNLEPGDGLLWASHKSNIIKEFGSFIFAVNPIRDSLVRIEIDHKVKIESTFVGAIVYLNHDRSLKIKLNYQSMIVSTKKRSM